KCPFHNGATKESLVIDRRTQRVTCFSECGQEGLVGLDVIDLCVWIHTKRKRDDIDSRSKAATYLLGTELPNIPKEQVVIQPHSRPSHRSRAHDTLPSHSLRVEVDKEEIQRLLSVLYHYKIPEVMQSSPYKLPKTRQQEKIANEIMPVLLYEQ